HLGGVVVAVQDRAEVGAWSGVRDGAAARVVGRELSGVIGSARQQDRRVLDALRHEDDRVQFYPVAHGDHHLAPDVIETIIDGLEFGRRFTWQGGVLRLRRRWFGE